MIAFSNPSGLYDPTANGYSHLAEVPAGYRLLFPAGQGGQSLDGALSEDFREQFAQALENVRLALAGGGAGFGDVVKVLMLIVDWDEAKQRVMVEEMARIWPDRPPPGTLIPVARLAQPGMLVELEAIAAVDAGLQRL